MSVARVGAVAIGRNEGARLLTCLQSVMRDIRSVVYVDSGSTDGSIAVAENVGATVIELDPSAPFTAARARNAGLKALLELNPDLNIVQFIDGDCELRPGWIDAAVQFLNTHPDTAIVCGRNRERYPERTAYNRLCDMEWDGPSGPIAACGGNSMMRVAPFLIVGGFDGSLIAGEEPDLCFRIRSEGWRVERLAVEMTLHDANMTRLDQWWRRNVRSGYAIAQAAQRRGSHDPALRRKLLSNVVWSLPPLWLLWPLLWLRVRREKGGLYASHIVAGKIPHVMGQIRFWRDRRRGSAGELIEWK